eukprot:4463718-Pyramimonas_sp.AAC.1
MDMCKEALKGSKIPKALLDALAQLPSASGHPRVQRPPRERGHGYQPTTFSETAPRDIPGEILMAL